MNVPYLSKHSENNVSRSFFNFDLIDFYFLNDFKVF
jgi:hypothetical protein